ncbi:MAG: hypothetical protein MI867_24750, partial [Pseudomonadales bacterium]|nr:hypothetical protein [Pseudomonadales bacterium]
LRVAREAIEEYGVPAAHARWSADQRAAQRREREDEEWQQNVRRRTESPAEQHQRPGEEEVHREEEMEQRVEMEEEIQPVVQQDQEPVAGPSNWQELPGDYEDYGDEPEDWE